MPDVARALAARVLARPAHARACAARRRACPTRSTGGRDTVGLRVPDQPLALALLARVRRRDRGAVGEPVRAGEPDDRRARARRPRRRRRPRARRRSVPRRRRVDDRRLLAATRPRSCASAAIDAASASSESLGARGRRSRPRARSRAPGHARVALRARRRASRSSTPDDARATRAASSSTAGERVGVLALDAPRARRCRDASSCSTPPRDVDEYARVLYARSARPTSADSTSCSRSRRRTSGIGAAVADRLRPGRRIREPSSVAAMARDRASDRRVRLGPRRAHGAAGAHRPAARRAIVYFGDTGRFPYGPKPADEVLQVRARDRRPARRPRRQDARRRVQQRGRGRARRARRTALDIPVIGVIEPGIRAARQVDRRPAASA